MTETNGRFNRKDGVEAAGCSRWGVVLLAHGSQRGTSKAECSCSWPVNGQTTPQWCPGCPNTPTGLQSAARQLQDTLGAGAQVVLSCLEFIEPHPDQAIRQMHQQGLRQIVVLPYLLGQGKHATLELDEALEELQSQLPDVELRQAPALGADPKLADLVVDRVRTGEAELPQGRSNSGVVGVMLVKAGTKNQYDDCRWLAELGHMVEKRLGLGYAVAVAQSHYGDPTMESAGQHLVEELGAASLVCVPYVFFPGMILRRNILGGMTGLQARYPDVSMVVAPPLGVDRRLVSVAADRVRAVWNGVSATR